MANTAKVVELIGSSDQSWEGAANSALQEASKTLQGITGIEVNDMTGKVTNGKITEYKVAVKVAFGIESNA